MSGRLALSSPWCRQAVPPEDRPAVEERIRDGYAVVVWSRSDHRGWYSYVLDTSGPVALEVVPKWPPRWSSTRIHHVIDAAITWIEEYDAATYAGVEVPVR